MSRLQFPVAAVSRSIGWRPLRPQSAGGCQHSTEPRVSGSRPCGRFLAPPCTVPSRSFAPYLAQCRVGRHPPVERQLVLMCGTLSSIRRATAWTPQLRVSVAMAPAACASDCCRDETQRDKRRNPRSCPERTDRKDAVIDPVLGRLDVPVEHRHASPDAQVVRQPMNDRYPIGVRFVMRNLPANARGSNISAPPPGNESSPAAVRSRSSTASLVMLDVSAKNAISTAVKHFR